MAHAIEEVEDIVSISSSLVINMGTLSENDRWYKA
jgi:hydroxyethylthiazole kinase